MADPSGAGAYAGRTLVIVCHPHLHHTSRVHRHWHQALQQQQQSVQVQVHVHALYSHYQAADGSGGLRPIDAAYEQQLLSQHDRIILQYPMYWYTFPSLLKEWLDCVLLRHYAYGTGGDQLHGKQLGVAISIGSADPAFYVGGHADKMLKGGAQHMVSLDAILSPLRATSTLIGTQWLPPFVAQGAYYLTDDQLQQVTEDYLRYVAAAEPVSTSICGQVDASRAHLAS